MNSSFLSQIQLTHSKTILGKEITFKQYRNFLKCLLGDTINADVLFNNFNTILNHSILTSNFNAEKLNYIDYIILGLTLRSKSLGDTINLQLKKNNEEINLNINLTNITNLLLSVNYTALLVDSQFENIIVTYRLPTITEVLHIEKNETYFYNFFIKTIKINDKEINFLDISYNEQDIILQQMPAKYFSAIVQKIQTILNFFKNLNLLDSVYDEQLFNIMLPALPNAQNIGLILKLAYNSNLDTIYSNIFALIKAGNFTGDFLDNCTPGEFFVFCKKLEAYNKEQAQSNDTLTNNITRQIAPDNLPPVNENSNFTLE